MPGQSAPRFSIFTLLIVNGYSLIFSPAQAGRIKSELKMNEAYNIDCMEYMQNVPDGYFDIAVCDPPYGIKINESIGRRKGDAHSGRKKGYWEAAPPPH